MTKKEYESYTISTLTFPIDIVYTWYNSTDKNVQAERDKHAISQGITISPIRYSDVGELKYSLRSVSEYMPWVNKIWVVIGDNQPLPEWLQENDKLKVVRHSEIFFPMQVNPTYNSINIESVLYRIKGLSEHFIYFNDDFFIGRPIGSDLFFTSDGKPKTWFGKNVDYDITYGNMYWDTVQHTLRTLRQYYTDKGIDDLPDSNKSLQHYSKSLTKSICERIETVLPNELSKLRRDMFRNSTSIEATTAILNIAYREGECISTPVPISRYFVNVNSLKGNYSQIIAHLKQHPLLFCLNNIETTEAEYIVPILEQYFPIKCMYEK
jgi:hypothetical protein